jgi:sugar phosphate isomerase/epimerase
MKLNRRHFLELTGAGLAASTLPTWAERPAPKNVPASDAVELAIATICCDGMGDEDFKYAFETIPQLGLKNVEFNVWYPRNLTPDGLRGIQDRCAARGLKPVCLQSLAFGGANKDAIVKDIREKLWLMECCRTLGCRRIKCGSYKKGDAGGLDSVITVLKELAPAAEERGILLCVENHAGALLENAEAFDRVFGAIDSPNVGLCLDPAHFTKAGVDPFAIATRFKDRLLHLDLKDFRDGEWARYGEGVVDLPKLIAQALADGYRGYLVIELSLRDRATMLADLKKGVEMFRRFGPQ